MLIQSARAAGTNCHRDGGKVRRREAEKIDVSFSLSHIIAGQRQKRRRTGLPRVSRWLLTAVTGCGAPDCSRECEWCSPSGPILPVVFRLAR